MTAWRQTVLAIISSPNRSRDVLATAVCRASIISRTSAQRLRHVEKRRHAIELERARPKIFQADAHALERAKVLAEPIGIARTELERLGKEQFLAQHLIRFETTAQFLEKDALMRRMLIHQHEAIRRFPSRCKAG